ncbi:hypothetical protein R3P38DRAFT_2769897 [Favolaschia claudopus]|uniref:Uncharacterized protein n=1 Tax=Favolaschia claudopus TaxID=2862362 RepID=A0AAW0CMZ8_9AGAR
MTNLRYDELDPCDMTNSARMTNWLWTERHGRRPRRRGTYSAHPEFMWNAQAHPSSPSRPTTTTPIKTSDMPPKSRKSTPAQLEAAARYRERHRKNVKDNPNKLEEYQARARRADARYRERHGERVYCRQADKRATCDLRSTKRVRGGRMPVIVSVMGSGAFVKKYGAEVWLKRNRKSMQREREDEERPQGDEGYGGEEGDEEGEEGSTGEDSG